MTRLLLDYPWPLEAGLGPDPGPQNVLRDYLHLLERTKLIAVRFIEEEECVAFWKLLEGRKGRGRFDFVMRLIHHCKRNPGSLCRAAPLEPQNLRESWKRALRDELGDLTDWRNPQIVVPTLRCSDWQPVGNEASIRCEPCEDQPASTHLRVLVVLEDYATHPFAISDIDPWDLQRIHPPNLGVPRQYPALLPKPLLSKGIPLENLYAGLKICRRQGCAIEESYYFIPPEDFDPLGIDKDAWRKGRAFRYATAPDSDKSGPVDYNGIVWSWDDVERHWDVQTKPKHMRISHTGKRLPDPD